MAVGSAPHQKAEAKRLFAKPKLRVILFYLAILVVGIAVLRVRMPPPEGDLALTSAQFQPLTALDRPSTEPETLVTLPHSVDVPGGDRFWAGLYRFEVIHHPAIDEPVSVLVPGYTGRILVSVNGALLDDSRWTHSGLMANLTWPEIVPIPSELLRDGVNELEIRLVTRVGLKSYLGRIHVGPERILRPYFSFQQFLLVTVPQLLFAWQVAFGLSLVIVWAARRTEWACALFALILFFSAASNLPIILAEPLLPDVAVRLCNMAFVWHAALLIPFARCFVGRRLSAAHLLFLALPLGMTSGFFWLSPDHFKALSWYVAIPAVMAILVGTVAVFFDAAFRQGHGAAHVVSGGAVLALFIGCHDLPMLYAAAEDEGLFLGRFGMPVLLSVVSGVLMWRFAMALNAVDRFNTDLRREIATAEAALRVSLAREHAQERALTLEGERSRLTRDLHDGLAGQLVSMVALSRRDDARPGDFGAAARRALADLRLVIASMAEAGDDPGMMLANFRDHIQPQLRALGVALDWRMTALPEESGWSSSTALELFRLLQEAAINAARHSGADRVMIEVTLTTEGGIRVVVADQGAGGAADRPGGYGLANMRRRAQQIGGRLTIASGPGGTRVTLDLPRPRAAPSPSRMTMDTPSWGPQKPV